MNRNEIFKKAQRSYVLTDLIPAFKLKNKKFKDELEQEIGMKIANYNMLRDFCNDFGIDIANIYLIKDKLMGIFSYIDLDLGVSMDLYLENKQQIELTKNSIIKAISQSHKTLYRLRKEKDYMGYFNMINPQIKIIMLNQVYFDIEDKELRYTVFENVYSSMEYGLHTINPLILRDIKKMKNTERIEKLRRLMDRNCMIKIYRGETEHSTDVEIANSWTTHKSVAAFFATRFNCQNPILHEAHVSLDDIIAYIDTRNEKEVLVDYRNIKDHSVITPMTLIDIFERMPSVLYKYNKYKNKINQDLFIQTSSIHGIDHTKRVLFHAMLLSELEGLNNNEGKILALASAYHDIGRTHDYECEIHGTTSFQIVEGQKLTENLNKEDIEILKYVMENHSINDYKMNDIKNYKINNTEKAKRLLNALKDADALDRVRLKDLDIKYFRCHSSHELTVVAQQLLQSDI